MSRSWKTGVASLAAVSVAAGSLVLGAPLAQAAVGDTTIYDVSQDPGNSPDLYDITLGSDGTMWVLDDREDEFLLVNSSGAVTGVVPEENCSDDDGKAYYAGALWCFYRDTRVERYFADGRRSVFDLPIEMDGIDEEHLRTTVGADGRLWVLAGKSTDERVITTLQAVQTNGLAASRTMKLLATPMSADGTFGPVITIAEVNGDFVTAGSGSYRQNLLAVETGADGKMYFSWSPGWDVYTGEVTNVLGTFTTDGVVSSAVSRSNPSTTGIIAGKSAKIGDSIYFLGMRFQTEPWVRDVAGVPTNIQDDANSRQLYRSQGLSNDGMLSVSTSPTTVTTQNIDIDPDGLPYGYSSFVADASGYLWTTQSGGNSGVARVSTTGAVGPVVGMPLGNTAYGVVIGSDGNAWVAADDILVRVLTGAVPTNAAAPTLSQVDGVTVGAPISGTSGEWNDPSGTYEYQWQVCSSSDAATCTDIPGATSAEYTPTAADDGKYVRMASYATSVNGRSEPAYSGLVAVGAPVAPPAANPGAAVKATGSTAVIGNAQTMELDVPRKTKRGKKKLYEVFFTATDVPGTVTFTFKRRSKVKTVTVPIEDGIAEYRWKTPRKWPRGKTRVTATYVPSAGSPYTAAAVTDRVRVRGR